VSEALIQQQVRLALSQEGAVTFRNNVGAYMDDNARLVRYGVCNPGGSDLIGWKPVTITQDMVGKKLAVFLAVEIKGPKGRVTEDQANFMRAVLNAGGIAGVARSPEDAVMLINQ
jgi:hypothetical protein